MVIERKNIAESGEDGSFHGDRRGLIWRMTRVSLDFTGGEGGGAWWQLRYGSEVS